MHIYRGPQSTDKWKRTDYKSLIKWARNWRPGEAIIFDGTIEKSGTRHTDLGVGIDPEDIIHLHNGLLKYQKSRIHELEQENAMLKAAVEFHSEGLNKIYRILAIHGAFRAPSKDALLDAVRKIAEHFRLRLHARAKRTPPNIKWIKWDRI